MKLDYQGQINNFVMFSGCDHEIMNKKAVV